MIHEWKGLHKYYSMKAAKNYFKKKTKFAYLSVHVAMLRQVCTIEPSFFKTTRLDLTLELRGTLEGQHLVIIEFL